MLFPGWASLSASLRGKPVHRWANSTQDSITTGRPTQPSKGALPERPGLVMRKTVPLGPTGSLLQKASLPRLGVTARLPNIETNPRRQPKWEYREKAPNERTREVSRRRAKWNREKQFITYRVQSNDYEDAQQHGKRYMNRIDLCGFIKFFSDCI